MSEGGGLNIPPLAADRREAVTAVMLRGCGLWEMRFGVIGSLTPIPIDTDPHFAHAAAPMGARIS